MSFPPRRWNSLEIGLVRVVERRHVRKPRRIPIEVEVPRLVPLAWIVRECHVAQEVAREDRHQRRVARPGHPVSHIGQYGSDPRGMPPG